MARYALSKEGLINALQAEKGALYWCLECHLPVKMRKGKHYVSHFYHIQPSPTCRLYSKSEDHLLIQLQLQAQFPKGELEMEKPFLDIARVADLYWQRKRIVFEIQCSPLPLGEAKLRVEHYGAVGCSVVWLLDDRIFNRRRVGPAEEWVRKQGAYYVALHRSQPLSLIYDQFDVVLASRRLKKSRPLACDLYTPRPLPAIAWPSALPSCIQMRTQEATHYFRGDLLHRALRSSALPYHAAAIARWHALEKELMKERSLWTRWTRSLLERYREFLLFLLEKLG